MPRRSSIEHEREYKFMTYYADAMLCWACGRSPQDRPENWNAPFLIERAHIVNKPRREDSRAVVMLCSLCHRVSHGHRMKAYGVVDDDSARITLANMLWMKRQRDPERYDRKFLQANHVGVLPRACALSLWYQSQFSYRAGWLFPEAPYGRIDIDFAGW